MAVRVGDVVRGVRERHPSFTRAMVPDPLLLRFLSEYQAELAVMALDRDEMFLVQQASIVIANSPDNARGKSGAGTAGGFPVSVNQAGDVSTEDAEAGAVVEFDWAHASRLVDATPVLSATVNDITFNAPGWATDAFAGAVARVVAGPGIGQVRIVSSNTADTLYFDQPFDTAVTSESLVEVVIVDPGLNETVFGVALTGNPLGERQGYLVRIDELGQPYIDFSKPIIARYGKGIPLPPHHRIIGATITRPANKMPGVYRRDEPVETSDSTALTITGYAYRNRAPFPSAYIMGNELFLTGDAASWQDGMTIDLRFVPVPPNFSSMRDYVFVPGADRVLREAGALYAADRVAALGVTLDLKGYIDKKQAAENVFLQGISMRDTGYTFVTRDVMPY